MTTQLKANDAGHDDRSYYKADAILRCLNKKTGSNMELLLLETSNAYNNASTKKTNFDFHKGMYGSVAMLKTIADLYKYASFECFKDLKLYFIHMHTKHIRLWSISSPSPGIFVMTREDKCGIPTAFNDDTHILLDYIRFGWSLKERIEKTLAKIDDLEEAHKVKMKEYRYKKLPKDRDLSCLVNPAIIKITERVHACYFVNDGPDSSPLIPFLFS